MFFLIISALIELVGLLTYIHTSIVKKDATEVVKRLLEVDYVVLPITLAITPTGFMVYLYSLKQFSWESMKRAAQEWRWCCACCKHIKAIRMKVAVRHTEDATAPESTRVSAPSATYFDVPYTNGFTTISQQHSLIRDVQKPPSSEYGSIESTAI
jgi:hypothetical protein